MSSQRSPHISPIRKPVNKVITIPTVAVSQEALSSDDIISLTLQGRVTA